MQVKKLSKSDAIPYGRPGVSGWNYALSDIEGGSSIIYAEITGEHGERTSGDRSRVYYILDGEADFIVSGEKVHVIPGDVMPIPPHTVHNYFPTTSMLKVVLFMEFLDMSKLPKK
jgi:mannose-6-phosphate isomerase-like protein (cupin superfamily)